MSLFTTSRLKRRISIFDSSLLFDEMMPSLSQTRHHCGKWRAAVAVVSGTEVRARYRESGDAECYIPNMYKLIYASTIFASNSLAVSSSRLAHDTVPLPLALRPPCRSGVPYDQAERRMRPRIGTEVRWPGHGCSTVQAVQDPSMGGARVVL